MILNPKIRQVWADKTFELTNIGAGALLFGLLLIILGYVISFVLLRKN